MNIGTIMNGGDPQPLLKRIDPATGEVAEVLYELPPRTPEKLWCAMCGKWGNHQSGTCPELESVRNND